MSMRDLLGGGMAMRVALCSLSIFGCLTLTARALAGPPPGTVEEFPVSTIYRGEMGEIAPGPEDTIWLIQNSQYLSFRGIIERISMNGLVTGAFGLEPGLPADIAEGPNGDMWFTEDASNTIEENGVIVEEQNMIGRVSPSGAITKFPISNSGTKPYYFFTDGPLAIAPDLSGNMWFTDKRPNKQGRIFIGRITSDGHITEFQTPTGAQSNLPESSLPTGIAMGADGNMWFTDQGQNNEGQNLIGQITPSGKTTEFPIPTLKSMPTSIALGADGNIWFTEAGARKIGRITPAGDITEFSVPGINNALNGLTLGPDGNMWFTGSPGVNPIGSIAPTGALKTLDVLPSNASPRSIVAGGDGNIWFTDPRYSAPETLSTSFVGRIITPFVPANIALPVVSGQAVEGQALSVSEGSWTHEPTTFAYQWQRCDTMGLNCEDINGGVDSAYFLTTSDVGHTLRATVTASTVGGSSSASSNVSPVIQSPPPQLSPQILIPGPARAPVVGATMTWRFGWSSKGTVVKSLIAHGLPPGSFVEAACRGRGCAFTHSRSPKISSRTSCHRGRRCRVKGPTVSHGELNLVGLFKAKRLAVGARVTVSVIQTGWIGKSFVFVMQRNRAPSVTVGCLAPGAVSAVYPC
jgi:streptogramin lyase